MDDTIKRAIDAAEAQAGIRRMEANKRLTQGSLEEAMLDEKDRIARLDHPTEADIAWVHKQFGFARGGVVKPTPEFIRPDLDNETFIPHGYSPMSIKDEASFGPETMPMTDSMGNPKDAIGSRKGGTSAVSAPVIAELGLAMLEGARKYGRHNWRVAPVRLSVYYDAAIRHLGQWWEGEDIDPDSGIPHVIKAMACLMIIRDAGMSGTAIDDRPPSTIKPGWVEEINRMAAEVIERYPDAKPPYVKGDEK